MSQAQADRASVSTKAGIEKQFIGHEEVLDRWLQGKSLRLGNSIAAISERIRDLKNGVLEWVRDVSGLLRLPAIVLVSFSESHATSLENALQSEYVDKLKTLPPVLQRVPEGNEVNGEDENRVPAIFVLSLPRSEENLRERMSHVHASEAEINEKADYFRECQEFADQRTEGPVQSPFDRLDKSAVLQETRIFNDSHPNPKKCAAVITKILYLVNKGENFTRDESTQVFFAATKLFMSHDVMLRRMVYLLIKALRPSEEEVIVVTSSLTKDMTEGNDLYRASAIRVLCKITDTTLLTQLERFLKQAIVDKNPFVASAALVSGLDLWETPQNQPIVRRWVKEIQMALDSRDRMVQAHALALMSRVKEGDRQSMVKLISDTMQRRMGGTLGSVTLIRLARRLLGDGAADARTKASLVSYLEGCLDDPSHTVMIEAARTLAGFSALSGATASKIVTAVQLLLVSSDTVSRFAAARTLHLLSHKFPDAVAVTNPELEQLIYDNNSSLATMAITTLLKTGSEASVDKLMRMISSFIYDVPEDFKIVIVESVESLCEKYPSKAATLLKFISDTMREDSARGVKDAAVSSMIRLFDKVHTSQSNILAYLCDFIEDCEFEDLLIRVLSFLADCGCVGRNPRPYVRYVFNRIILESAKIRAAAVQCLVRFTMEEPSLRGDIRTLLSRAANDANDEVRDRVAFGLRILDEGESAQPLVSAPLPVSSRAIENALTKRLESPAALAETFDLNSVHDIVDEAAPEASASSAASSASAVPVIPVLSDSTTAEETATPAAEVAAAEFTRALADMPGFDASQLAKSGAPRLLTDTEAEYSVGVVKHHLLDGRIVLHFRIRNTVDFVSLSDVRVELELLESSLPIVDVQVVSCASIGYDETGDVLCVVTSDNGGDESAINLCSFSAVLHFMQHERDPDSGDVDPDGVEDEYQIEDVQLSLPDYIQKINVSSFRSTWESMDDSNDASDVFELTAIHSVKEAVMKVVDLLGMQVFGDGESVAEDAAMHVLYLSGLFQGAKTLVRAQFKLGDAGYVHMRIGVRTENALVSQLVMSTFG